MHPPEPALALTLPSLHDDTILSCRLYHPPCLDRAPRRGGTSAEEGRAWNRRAAVVAHPYAPMGGDYNNHVVGIVVVELLRAGFVVVTFNFRGAHPSGGKTSWTAKPETADYSAVVGFTVLYTRHFDQDLGRSWAPEPSAVSKDDEEPITLLMAGYSYGALVTTMLPPVSDILAPLASPAIGSAAAEIRLRAQSLAAQQASAITAMSHEHPSGIAPPSPHGPLAVRVGGDEAVAQRRSNDFSPRHSRSISLDGHKVREGISELMEKAKLRKKDGGRRSISATAASRGSRVAASRGIPELTLGLEEGGPLVVRPAYLLVSPLQGIIGHLAAMSFAPTTLFAKVKKAHHGGDGPDVVDECEVKLASNPTLAIFGDEDSFVHVSKLRVWASRMVSAAARRSAAGGGPVFVPVEVGGAGHAWVEHGAAEQLRDAIRHFTTTLTGMRATGGIDGSVD